MSPQKQISLKKTKHLSSTMINDQDG